MTKSTQNKVLYYLNISFQEKVELITLLCILKKLYSTKFQKDILISDILLKLPLDSNILDDYRIELASVAEDFFSSADVFKTELKSTSEVISRIDNLLKNYVPF